MATDYSNPGGSGDRTSGGDAVTVTFGGTWTGLVAGELQNLVDGGFGLNGTDSFDAFISPITSSHYIRFDFGSQKVIDEARWYTNSTSTAQGTWQWQGSNDASSWTNIGSSFTLSGGGGSSPKTLSELAGNTTGYRYYQMLGVSGTFNNGPWNIEIEFKIDVPFTIPTTAFTDGSTLQVNLLVGPTLTAAFADESSFAVVMNLPLTASFLDEAVLNASLVVLTASFSDASTLDAFIGEIPVLSAEFFDESTLVPTQNFPDPTVLPTQTIIIMTGR